MIKKILAEVNEIPNTRKDMKSFAWVMTIAFGLFGIVTGWKHHEAAMIVFTALSAFFLFMGICFPLALKPIHRVWMTLAIVMGMIMGAVLLSLLYFLALTPISLFLKLKSKQFFAKDFDKEASSYWQKRDPLPFDIEKYEKQY